MARQLRCPRCSAVNVLEGEEPPACAFCGYGTPNPRPLPGSAGASFKVVPKEQVTTTWETVPPSWWSTKPVTVRVGLGFFLLGLLVMLLLQFNLVHWNTAQLVVGSETTFGQDYGLWGVDGFGNHPGGGIVSYGYWDSEAAELDGIWLLRFGSPLLLVSLVLALVAAVAATLGKPALCNGAGWGAVTLGATMVVLFALGIDAQQDQVQAAAEAAQMGPASGILDFSWAAGFYLGIAAVALVAIATSLGPVRGEEPEAEPVVADKPLA